MSTKNGVLKAAQATLTGLQAQADIPVDIQLGVDDAHPIVLQQYKFARGQASTASASDTIVTGLATVVAVIAGFDDNPGDDPNYVSASIGDQAGAPAAGSFLLKTWKNTGGTDPTPLAATTFTKKVNWIAIGT